MTEPHASRITPHAADLQSDNWQVRWQAAEALAEQAQRGDNQALEALATVRHDPYWEVRHAAIRAWAMAEDSRKQPLLLEALADPMYWIGQAAIEGLVRIGPPAVEPLMEALGDARPEVPVRAAGALGQLGDRRAVEPLLQALQNGPPSLQQAAATALGQLRAVEPLLQALQNGPPSLQQAAAAALGQLGSLDAQPALRALANDRRRPESVRRAAREALAKIEEAWSTVRDGAIQIARERPVSAGAIAVAEDREGARRGDHEGAKYHEGAKEAKARREEREGAKEYEGTKEHEGARREEGSGWKRKGKPWWRWF